jgi:hypothetical protein
LENIIDLCICLRRRRFTQIAWIFLWTFLSIFYKYALLPSFFFSYFSHQHQRREAHTFHCTAKKKRRTLYTYIHSILVISELVRKKIYINFFITIRFRVPCIFLLYFILFYLTSSHSLDILLILVLSRLDSLFIFAPTTMS